MMFGCFVVIVCLTVTSSTSPSKVKVNRKVSPSSHPSSGSYDHVISGLEDAAYTRSMDTQKSRPEMGSLIASVLTNLPPKRGFGPETEISDTGNDIVSSSAEWLSPLSSEGSKVLAVLTDVSENLASLRDIMGSLRDQNQVLSKQMRRIQLKQCKRFPADKVKGHHEAQDSDRQSTQHDEGSRRLVTDPVSSAHRKSGPDDVTANNNNNMYWFPFGLVGRGGGGALIAAAEQVVEGQKPSEEEGQTKAKCPSQFTFSAEMDRCYHLSGDRITWKMARERCRWKKGSLVSIDSSREQRIVNEMARSNSGTQHCDFWVGLTRQGQMSTHDWYWEKDGHLPVYTNWNENEPNNGNGNENCAQMLWVFNWKWNDAPCSHGNACFICETRSGQA